jgi:hypothetical protein
MSSLATLSPFHLQIRRFFFLSELLSRMSRLERGAMHSGSGCDGQVPGSRNSPGTSMMRDFETTCGGLPGDLLIGGFVERPAPGGLGQPAPAGSATRRSTRIAIANIGVSRIPAAGADATLRFERCGRPAHGEADFNPGGQAGPGFRGNRVPVIHFTLVEAAPRQDTGGHD